MAGVLIYKNAFNHYFSIVSAENRTYFIWKSSLLENKKNTLIWEKSRVDLRKIDDSKHLRANLIERLNNGENINLNKELSKYFI